MPASTAPLNADWDPSLPSDNLLDPYRWPEVFGNDRPVEVELGAGDGTFLLAWATQHPDRNFIAVERLLGRARKIARRIVRQDLRGVRLLRLESAYFIRHLCEPGSVSAIHIMFPDPWPKRRHFRFRLIQPEFLQAAHQALVPGGVIRFTTDHDGYFQWTRRIWATQQGWEDLGPWDAENDPRSDFEMEFLAEGRKFNRCQWRKAGPPV